MAPVRRDFGGPEKRGLANIGAMLSDWEIFGRIRRSCVVHLSTRPIWVY
jgi:hypothetical protein